jgi:hypothetical protein
MEFLALNQMIEPVVRALLWSEFGITNTGAPILGN